MTRRFFAGLWNDRRGATAVEYGVVAGGVAMLIAGALFMLGANVTGLFDTARGMLSGKDTPAPAPEMREVLRQTFETDREGWSGLAPRRTLDRIGTGLSLANESRIGDAGEAVSRTFDIPAGATRADIGFDMSFVDSWDGKEQAKVYVNGIEIMAGTYRWNGDAAPSLVQTPVEGMTIETELTSSVQAGTWSGGTRGTDYTYRVTISVDDPGATLRLGFGTSLDQDQRDESLLIGNVVLRAAP